MAAIIDHFLKCDENLKQMLLQRGVITEDTATAGFPYLLNMRACCPDAWQQGEEEGFWPVAFPTEDELYWASANSSNEDPAFFVSLLLPQLVFTYESFYEDEWDGKFSLQNGVFTLLESPESQEEE